MDRSPWTFTCPHEDYPKMWEVDEPLFRGCGHSIQYFSYEHFDRRRDWDPVGPEHVGSTLLSGERRRSGSSTEGPRTHKEDVIEKFQPLNLLTRPLRVHSRRTPDPQNPTSDGGVYSGPTIKPGKHPDHRDRPETVVTTQGPV